MSLTVDISLAQVALITAETAQVIRRLFPQDHAIQDLALRIDQLVAARADTLEARMQAKEVLNLWERFADTPEQRELFFAHQKIRNIAKQDAVAKRLRQLEAALKAESRPSTRRPPKRRTSVA